MIYIYLLGKRLLKITRETFLNFLKMFRNYVSFILKQTNKNNCRVVSAQYEIIMQDFVPDDFENKK